MLSRDVSHALMNAQFFYVKIDFLEHQLLVDQFSSDLD